MAGLALPQVALDRVGLVADMVDRIAQLLAADVEHAAPEIHLGVELKVDQARRGWRFAVFIDNAKQGA
jgi:hypothetical protein